MVQRVANIIRMIELRLMPKMLMYTECLMSTWIVMYMECLMSTWIASTIIKVIINHPMQILTVLVVYLVTIEDEDHSHGRNDVAVTFGNGPSIHEATNSEY